jgi:hypothetical protein
MKGNNPVTGNSREGLALEALKYAGSYVPPTPPALFSIASPRKERS